MNRLPLLASGSVAGLLALLILIETQTVGGMETGVLAPASGEMRPSRGATQVVPTSRAVQQSWAGTILARPIFSPSRRPSEVAAASTELPRLAGIIIGPSGATAIFASAESRAIMARSGMRAGPYLVREVAANGVSVVGPNGPQVLHPSYDPSGSHTGMQEGNQAAAGGSILDLLRARIQNGEGMRGGMLPNLGNRPAGTPQR